MLVFDRVKVNCGESKLNIQGELGKIPQLNMKKLQ